MRYFMTFLLVLSLGCSDTETSDTAEENDAATDAGSADNSSTDASADAAMASDMAFDMTRDMSLDASGPRDSGSTDAATSDAAIDGGSTDADVSDMTVADAGQADASLPDVGRPDMSRFECPPPMYNGQICTQVIVWVRDQDTGACCEYPTPCHIPDGDWGEMTYGSESQCSVR